MQTSHWRAGSLLHAAARKLAVSFIKRPPAARFKWVTSPACSQWNHLDRQLLLFIFLPHALQSLYPRNTATVAEKSSSLATLGPPSRNSHAPASAKSLDTCQAGTTGERSMRTYRMGPDICPPTSPHPRGNSATVGPKSGLKPLKTTPNKFREFCTLDGWLT